MWRLLNSFKESLRPRLSILYGEKYVDRFLERFALIAGRYNYLERRCSPDDPCWDERSCVLITYGDMVVDKEELPLQTLHRFLREHLRGVITGVHILPFFPYSSDDGFSVIDYRAVDPKLGSWDDLSRMGEEFRLMFDLVINHVSSQSSWFEDYLGAIAPARNYFIECDEDVDVSAVVRPRTSPLLTPVGTVKGRRYVWTTFSDDQIDLDFSNPDVLLEILDIFLGYINQGAGIIRLDAIAYLWKELGTPCINLEQTHTLVKLLRDIIENVTPGTLLLTETNLPHQENISYFGDGDEAHLVYQFSLPPLLLHTLQSGSSAHLYKWASELEPPPPGCSFFNFTASHDGIGVRPLEGLLSDEEIDRLVDTVRSCGGFVSSRTGSDGKEHPYELNITYFDAMRDPDKPNEISWQVLRFICSQTIMLSLRGIPAIYFHSLTAARNNISGVAVTGVNRTINRGRWNDKELRDLMESRDNATALVFNTYRSLIKKRGRHKAFHPDSRQEIIQTQETLFAVKRIPRKGKPVYCIHNVSCQKQEIDLFSLEPEKGKLAIMHDIILDEEIKEKLHLLPYQCCWLV